MIQVKDKREYEILSAFGWITVMIEPDGTRWMYRPTEWTP